LRFPNRLRECAARRVLLLEQGLVPEKSLLECDQFGRLLQRDDSIDALSEGALLLLGGLA
jgi:hypothetical protein